MSKTTEKLIAPLNKIRSKFSNLTANFFGKITDSQKFWFVFALFCVLTTVLINNPLWRSTTVNYEEGDIARESIISPADITKIDEKETERIRQVAKDTVRPIFNFESNRSEAVVQNFRSAWEDLQRKKAAAGSINTNAGANADTNSNVGNSENSDIKWSGAGGEQLGKVFANRKFSENEIESVTRALSENTEGVIYGDQDQPYLEDEITLIDRQKPNQQDTVKLPQNSRISLTRARSKLKTDLEQIKSLSETEQETFYKALSPLIQPNLVYDSQATENAKIAESLRTQPLKISLKRGQTIVREGDTITQEVLGEISAIQNYSNSSRQWNRFLGLLALISALFWVAWKFIQHRGNISRIVLSEEKTFMLFGFIVVVQTALMAIFFRLADFTALQNVKAPLNDPTIWSFAIPFAFSSLLMNLLADRRTALFIGFFAAFLAGLLAPKGLEIAFYAAISSAVAVYGIGRYRSRQSVTLAGILVGVSCALTAVALIGYTQQPFILNTVLLSIGCGLASGLVTGAVTAMFLPLCENFFGILTDVKLLELSNADLPALGQLALRAPGTNQHSHAVGQLCEDACRKIGANGLLSRIGALYHDIGKTAAPEHFVENQHGRNPHDRLKPTQSAKIIISHVTYGAKMAKEMGLPAKIIDFIYQHHGTRTLHYFLKKAQAEAAEGEEIPENDFRYPGPKPQFKEAAIMMIADSCEAAGRSLSEPTPENIRYIVTKIVDAIVSDDQLDECDLTLRELTQIRESMIKSLNAIYHSRMEYPGYSPPNSSSDIKIVPDELTIERGMRYENPADIPISKGGEVEDEAIDRSQQPNVSEAKNV